MDMIDAYLEHMRRTSRSGSSDTIEGRRQVLKQLHRDLPYGLDRTCQEELENWLHEGSYKVRGAEVPWSQNTKAAYWKAMRSFYKWAADPRDPWISEDPTAEMTPVQGTKGVARDITDEQLWEILSRAEQPYQLWATIAAYQGLRCCELSGLDREHVNERQLVVVRGKGGDTRVHDTDPLVWEAVRDLPPGPVCRDISGGRASAHYVTRMASRHFQGDLGLEGVTMHRLRHWLGVRIQAQYKDIRVTQEMLGHKSLASTQIYTKATLEQQREARAMLPRPRAA